MAKQCLKSEPTFFASFEYINWKHFLYKWFLTKKYSIQFHFSIIFHFVPICNTLENHRTIGDFPAFSFPIPSHQLHLIMLNEHLSLHKWFWKSFFLWGNLFFPETALALLNRALSLFSDLKQNSLLSAGWSTEALLMLYLPSKNEIRPSSCWLQSKSLNMFTADQGAISMHTSFNEVRK